MSCSESSALGKHHEGEGTYAFHKIILGNIQKMAKELEAMTISPSIETMSLAHRAQQDLQKSAVLINQNSPILTLPQEILALIFETVQRLLRSEAQARYFPFCASHVSLFFREVALGSPFLWTNVDISPRWRFEWIELYLSRSATHPIRLHMDNEIEFTNPKDIDRLCGIIVPHFPRCRTIAIRGNAESGSTTLFSLLNQLRVVHFPILEEFVFEGKESDEGTLQEHANQFLFLHEAPKLRDVRLGGLGALYCRPSLTFTTTLHLAAGMNRVTYIALGEMLESSPLLTTLAVYDDLLCDWPGATFKFHVPSLLSLQIYGNMLSVSELILSSAAPKLEELVIAPVVVHDLTVFLSVPSWERPEFPCLKSLTMAPAHPEAFEALTLAAKCFPFIETLVFPNIYPREFVSTFNQSDEIMWPRLNAMAFNDIDQKSEHAIYAVVLFRNRSGLPVKKIYVDSYSLQNMQRLDQLKEEVIVEVSDLWNIRRMDALYSDEEDRFIGAVYEEDVYHYSLAVA